MSELAFIYTLFSNQTPLGATFSRPKERSSPLKKCSIRSLKIKEALTYQFSYQENEKVRHRNFSPTEAVKEVAKLLETSFLELNLFTKEASWRILISKTGKPTILKQKDSTPQIQEQAHNRTKNTPLQEGDPLPFLVELGILNKEGKVVNAMRDKWKQINHFLSLVDPVLPHLTSSPIEIVDIGCGKAYLTFALFHFLTTVKGLKVEIYGIDRKKDVIESLQGLCKKLHLKGLHFIEGDIKDWKREKPVDLVVCLHACDTATDYALFHAIRWQAKAILAAPCCQHELFSQIENESMTPLLKHGILKERLTGLITDAARSQLLELHGYQSIVQEFIDSSHTPKNLLIRAIRKKEGFGTNLLREQYEMFKNSFHIAPTLEKLLEVSHD